MGKSSLSPLGTFSPISPAAPVTFLWDNTTFPASNPSPALLAVTHCCPQEETESQSQQLLLTPFTAHNTNTGGRPKRRWKAELFMKQAHCGTLERKICLRGARSGMPVLAGAAFPREAGFLRGQEPEPGREPRGKPAAPFLSLIKWWFESTYERTPSAGFVLARLLCKSKFSSLLCNLG